MGFSRQFQSWNTKMLALSTISRFTTMKRTISSGKRREKQPKPSAPLSKNSNGFGFGAIAAETKKKKNKKTVMEVEQWRCIGGCGACCKLDKGPTFPSPEEIFSDTDPSHLQLYKSMIGEDGWCIHYEHSNRTCSIYADRPSFCRVEHEVFDKLYGIPQRRFNKEACSACKDTISSVYGSGSEELKKFNCAIRVPVTQK